MNWSKITVLDLEYEAKNGKCPNPLMYDRQFYSLVLYSKYSVHMVFSRVLNI